MVTVAPLHPAGSSWAVARGAPAEDLKRFHPSLPRELTMRRTLPTICCTLLLMLGTTVAGVADDDILRGTADDENVRVAPDDVGPDSIVYWQGEYVGQVDGAQDGAAAPLAAQVVAKRGDNYELILYQGGLPGHGWDADQRPRRLAAKRQGEKLAFDDGQGLRYRVEQGTIVVARDEEKPLGELKRIFRTSPTVGLRPPAEAVALFDGGNVDQWREGAILTDDGLLEQGARSKDDYGDMYLHVEYLLPYWDNDGRTNSGVYIQDRYEVQILDSFGHPGGKQEDGALYTFRAPDVNVSLPPEHWQTFDILFRAPRFDAAGKKTENARISVLHNGVLVHDDVELPQGTGHGRRHPETERAHLHLQRHRGPGLFRNVWLVEGANRWPATVRQSTLE